MRKALAFAAAALILAGCGTEIKQDINVTDREAVTAAEDREVSEEKVTTDEEEKPVETTAATKKEQPEKSEKKAEKKADPDDINLACMDTVEVYQQVKLSEFMFDSNAKLLNGDEMLDTEELGEHEVTLELELDGGKAEKTVTYNVVDTTPPVMLLGYDMYVGVGEYFDPNDYLSYADNYDSAPTMSWDGEVDTSAAGTYYITVYISDGSGNLMSQEVNVTVGGTVTDPYYDDSVTYFSDFMQQYDAPDREFGIDVSRWQGDVDYDAVAAEGCSFVLMRMGYGEYGGADLDECYYDNMSGAVAAGLDVGVYFYSTDTTQEGARETARRIVEVLDGQQLDLPIAFDWEDFQNFQNYGMSIHDLSEVYEAFADEVEKSGYEAMLYSSRDFLEKFWENRNDRPVWLAHYVNETTYEGDWLLWQRCGTGRIAGIDGAVDLNVLQRE